MGERTIERDEPVMDEQGEAVRRATERAERAEAELARLKAQGAAKPSAAEPESVEAETQAAAEHHLIQPGSLDRSKHLPRPRPRVTRPASPPPAASQRSAKTA